MTLGVEVRELGPQRGAIAEVAGDVRHVGTVRGSEMCGDEIVLRSGRRAEVRDPAAAHVAERPRAEHRTHDGHPGARQLAERFGERAVIEAVLGHRDDDEIGEQARGTG